MASGDPLGDRVVIWARVSGAGEETGLGWTVAADPALDPVVAASTATGA